MDDKEKLIKENVINQMKVMVKYLEGLNVILHDKLDDIKKSESKINGDTKPAQNGNSNESASNNINSNNGTI